MRTDILEKRGDIIHLIEVKAKSFDPNKPNEFFGEKGGIEKKWKPYLFDLAFQKKAISEADAKPETSKSKPANTMATTAEIEGVCTDIPLKTSANWHK
jgi:hypothetical protein